MFGWGQGRKNRNCKRHKHGEERLGKAGGRCHRGAPCRINLDKAEIGRRYLVIINPDKKTMEMGIYHSAVITVHKNEEGNPNIVVGVGESRYIIPRDLAKRIIIK